MTLLSLRVVLCVGTVFVALSVGSPAHAQTDAAKRQKAGQLFKTGTALASENRWREALAAFEQAALLVPHASTTFNMAYCERGLGRLTRARVTFLRALEQDSTDGGLNDDQRISAASYGAEVEKQLVRVRVFVSPEDATLSVDGRPLAVETESPMVVVAGLRPPGPGLRVPAAELDLLLDPGSHVFVIAHRDGRQDSLTRAFTEGERASLEIKLPELTKAPTPMPSPEPDPVTLEPPPETVFWNGQRIGAMLVTVAAVGGLAAGIGLGVTTAATWSDAQAACPDISACPNDTAFEKSLDAKRQGNLATVVLVTTGLASAGATYLWLAAPSSQARVGVALGGFMLQGSF